MESRTTDSWILVSDAMLDVGAADSALRDERAGGVCIFVGTTRRFTGESETAELRYDAFSEMAMEEMARLAKEAADKWPVVRAVLHHRTGVVRPAEASVLVGVACPHRGDAFEAARFLIDSLKERVPVWKKEIYSDGSTEWVEPGRTP
ncbi:MAG: molybdopterin synthase catalytic subunit [Rhodothermales bacterium]|jgi:molybdopterin synthase catalytic subunit